jgi:hypothetical protein
MEMPAPTRVTKFTPNALAEKRAPRDYKSGYSSQEKGISMFLTTARGPIVSWRNRVKGCCEGKARAVNEQGIVHVKRYDGSTVVN